MKTFCSAILSQVAFVGLVVIGSMAACAAGIVDETWTIGFLTGAGLTTLFGIARLPFADQE